ncbi:hypothetical protein BT93_C2231 [Corymbia citriodora subsp. variegata]|nr:hypothetical protein BT93_C2231 [Corymbia citriodora subsp. variegata]
MPRATNSFFARISRSRPTHSSTFILYILSVLVFSCSLSFSHPLSCVFGFCIKASSSTAPMIPHAVHVRTLIFVSSLMMILQPGRGQGAAPSPSPEGSSSDGRAIDQGVAYVLLLVALAITYLFH